MIGSTVDSGALCLDGRRRLLLAGEYPYYRDTTDLWPVKLAAMREAGLEVVTFYVPWRHHDPDGTGRPRFTGPGNRDLPGFLAAIRAAGLYALPKPGPHVHAELPLGGLPDRMSPSTDPDRVAAVDAAGRPLRAHGRMLPSAADPVFAAASASWLGAVGAVLAPHQYPDGPVVAVQVGNEGTYGETALPIDGYDYALPAVAAFRDWAGGMSPPRSAPSRTAELEPYVRWGAWVARSLGETLRGYVDALGLRVPAFANVSAPARPAANLARAAGRHDAWLARGPGRTPGPAGPHYGYTNWAGDAARDDEALLDQVLTARRGQGPCLEENWSLRWAAPGGRAPSRAIFHSLLGLACGATGISVYTACATAHWDAHLRVDRAHLRETTGDAGLLDPPYGGDAPIDPKGGPGPGNGALRVLTHFLAAEGPHLLASRPGRGLRWYGYHPYTAVNAWRAGAGADPLPPSGLTTFATWCLGTGTPFSPHNLADPRDLDDVDSGDPVVAQVGPFLARAAQHRLARLVAGGADILLVGQPPSLDEHLAPCTVLADALRDAGDRYMVVPPASLGDALDRWPAVSGAGGRLDRLDLRLTGPDGTSVFLFNREPRTRELRVPVADGELSALLPGYGCAAVRLDGDRIAACYAHGPAESGGEPVSITYGPDRIAATGPGDLSVVPGADGFDVAHSGGADNLITLPTRWSARWPATT